MAYNYLVLGAGMMGEAIVYDLLKDPETSSICAIDKSSLNLDRLARNMDDNRLLTRRADVGDSWSMKKMMNRADVAIGAASYDYNAQLAKIAIESKTHFCDLGGNNYIVEEEFAMNELAKAGGVKIIPDCGIAPGAVSTIVAFGILENGIPDEVYIRVGGLPQHPQGILNYMKVFSVRGLINEYKEDTEILDHAKISTTKSMRGIESVIFKDERFNGGTKELEAAYTSGGSSTLAKTFQGQIQQLNYKTLRYKGHWEKIQLLEEMGLFSEKKILVNNTLIVPRDLTEKLIDDMISYKDNDMLLMRVTLVKDGKRTNYDLVDFQDEKTGHTAMQRTTGYSAAIVATMMAKNQIKENGVLTIEKHVPPELFVKEWAKRNIILKKS